MSASDDRAADNELERRRREREGKRPAPRKPRSESKPGDPAAAADLDEHGRLKLPPVPDKDDLAGLRAWMTEALNLNHEHPVTGARHEGIRGHDGHAVILRANAPAIRFEPAARMGKPTLLIETLTWRLQDDDGDVHAYGAPHCRQITTAFRRLAGTVATISEEQETDAIVGEHLQRAAAIEGHTSYAAGGQAYEAAVALRRDVDPATGRWHGPPHVLIDSETDELVIGVSDLAETARRTVGSSLPRGWLDARMDGLGWRRIRIDGHALPGQSGRQGPHARIDAYRGHRLDQPEPPST